MESPFDNIINKGTEERRSNKNIWETKKSKRKDINFKSNFTAKSEKIPRKIAPEIERLMYLAIIILLVILVFINPVCPRNCKSDDSSSLGMNGNIVMEQQLPDAKIAVATETETPAKSAVETGDTKDEPQEDVADEETVVKKEVDKAFITNFDFKIEDIEIERGDDGKMKKPLSIKFSMWNRWKEFNSRIEVYYYDDSSEEVIKEIQRAQTFIKSKEGDMKTYSLKEFSPKYFDPLTKDSEIVELRLYDTDTDELLAKKTKVIV